MEYALTFSEAMDVLKRNDGWVQGERFKKGCILKEGLINIVCHDFNTNTTSDVQLTHNIVNQHYRLVQFQKDA